MIIADDLVINPVEAPTTLARPEMSLSEMGLSVLDFSSGESAIEGTLRTTSSGQRMSSRRGKPRTLTSILAVREDSDVDLPTAGHYFQRIVGELQKRETWIRRDHLVGGDFAGPLLFRITGEVGVRDFAGWQRGESPDVTLTLTADFAGLSTEEVEQGPFESTAGSRHLVFQEEPGNGTLEGLWRCRVKNKGSEDWRGLILSRECEYAPEDLSDPTVQMAYLAKNLTPKGGAEVATVSGAEVVRHTSLTAGWLTILGSEISGVGHMTHRGPRVMWMRIYDPGSVAGDVQLQLQARALGASRWDDSFPIVPTPVVGGWMLVNLGVARPEDAVLGEGRWEWRLQARAQSGAGQIRIRDVYLLSTEQYCLLSEPYQAPVADAQSQKPAGKGANNASIGEVAWTNPENIKASDDSRATVTLNRSFPRRSQYLVASNFAFALPEAATPIGVVATVERGHAEGAGEIRDQSVRLVKGGVIQGDDKAVSGLFTNWKSSDQAVNYGGSADLWGTTLTYSDINSSGFGLAFAAMNEQSANCEVRVDQIKLTVFYTEAADESKVCFATRSVEPRSDGVFRQAPTDDVWGRLVPDGFLPTLPAGGVEGRQTRSILIPSAGDFETLPDGATPSLEGRTYSRDGYHFAREAAA